MYLSSTLLILLATAWTSSVLGIPGTALVLSGGGAKGVFEVGILQGVCKRHKEWINSWNMVLGTSIGALNSGILAQFPPDQQCEKAVPALKAYWDNVKSADDVFISSHPGPFGDKACLTPQNGLRALEAFSKRGGMCDPVSGETSYNAAVKAEKVRNSGMGLRVVASHMPTGEPHWFTEQDDHIVEACMASGSIAPLVYPKEVPKDSGDWYVDGGIFANTPIVKALSEGATSVLVIILETIDGTGAKIVDFSKSMKEQEAGKAVLEYYMAVVNSRVFLKSEMEIACKEFPFAGIYAYMPSGDLGSLTDFSEENIAKLLQLGLDAAVQPPVDLCKAAGISRFDLTAADKFALGTVLLIGAITCIVSALLGACLMKSCIGTSNARGGDGRSVELMQSRP